MSVPNYLIATPIRFAAASYTLRVDVGGTTEDLTVGFTVGRNYWLSGDGQADADGGVGGVGDLLRVVSTALGTHTEITGGYAALNSSFLVELGSLDGGDNITIDWPNSTLDESIFGFADAIVGPTADAVVGTLMPRGLWRPMKAATVDSRDRQPIVGGISAAVSGRTRVSRFATPLREREIEIARLHQSVTLAEYAPATEPYGTLEEAWINSMSLGRPFRLYEDETVRTSSSYGLYRTKDLGEPYDRDPRYNVRWRANLSMRRVV
ncbi:MAG: hypothetical protein RMA76_38130 [Deltaproteobacteria bacterium]|jgi:hypothetical protein